VTSKIHGRWTSRAGTHASRKKYRLVKGQNGSSCVSAACGPFLAQSRQILP
jgi:hypothetical protein